jgi:hypothetical protein
MREKLNLASNSIPSLVLKRWIQELFTHTRRVLLEVEVQRVASKVATEGVIGACDSDVVSPQVTGGQANLSLAGGVVAYPDHGCVVAHLCWRCGIASRGVDGARGGGERCGSSLAVASVRECLCACVVWCIYEEVVKLGKNLRGIDKGLCSYFAML